jgi:DNA-binding NtrC family response regulator
MEILLMDSEKIKILIVDDEESITKLLATMLKDQVDEIEVAYNGRDALNIVKKNKNIALILTDIKMPIMDGIEFVKRIREMGHETPVIFFTGYGSQEYMVQALEYGAYDFIDKPNLENLEEIVGRCINEKFGKSKKVQEKKAKTDWTDDYKKVILKK